MRRFPLFFLALCLFGFEVQGALLCSTVVATRVANRQQLNYIQDTLRFKLGTLAGRIEIQRERAEGRFWPRRRELNHLAERGEALAKLTGYLDTAVEQLKLFVELQSELEFFEVNQYSKLKPLEQIAYDTLLHDFQTCLEEETPGLEILSQNFFGIEKIDESRVHDAIMRLEESDSFESATPASLKRRFKELQEKVDPEFVPEVLTSELRLGGMSPALRCLENGKPYRRAVFFDPDAAAGVLALANQAKEFEYLDLNSGGIVVSQRKPEVAQGPFPLNFVAEQLALRVVVDPATGLRFNLAEGAGIVAQESPLLKNAEFYQAQLKDKEIVSVVQAKDSRGVESIFLLTRETLVGVGYSIRMREVRDLFSVRQYTLEHGLLAVQNVPDELSFDPSVAPVLLGRPGQDLLIAGRVTNRPGTPLTAYRWKDFAIAGRIDLPRSSVRKLSVVMHPEAQQPERILAQTWDRQLIVIQVWR